MTELRGVPPGRAGRLWLEHRLAVAERGADLLDHKLRILRMELQRLLLVEERTERTWAQAAAEAERWSLRAGAGGGRAAFRRSTAPAEVSIRWDYLMGLRLPADVAVAMATPHPGRMPASGAAVELSDRAHRVALEAAVRHAVAVEARRRVESEVTAVRRRVRAIQERWVPRLQRAIADLTLTLEEMEHAEAVRLRRRAAIDGPTAGGGGRR